MVSGPGPARLHRQGHRRAARDQRPARRASGRSPSGAGACWRSRTIPAAVREAVAPAQDRPAAPGRRSRSRPRPWRKRARSSCCRRSTVTRTAAPRADIERRRATLLRDAARPIIYAGGGVHASGAHEALAAVAEYLQAGVAQSAEGKGAVERPERPLARRRTLAQEPAARVHRRGRRGARGGQLALRRWPPSGPSSRSSRSTWTREEIGRNHTDTLGLVGDARATLEAPAGAAARRRAAAALAQGRARGSCARSRSRRGHAGAQARRSSSLAARGHARRRHRHRRHDPDRLLLAAVLAGLRAAHVPHVVVLRQPRLRVSRRPSGPRSRARTGRWSAISGDGGFMYNVAGALHRGAARDQRGRGRLQRQRLRQRGPRPRRVLGRQLRRRAAPTPTS